MPWYPYVASMTVTYSASIEQIDVWLIDDVGPDHNPNLDFVLTDTVRLIE
jgi:hypothetical protein